MTLTDARNNLYDYYDIVSPTEDDEIVYVESLKYLIEKTNDPKLAIIITYNKLDPTTYQPNSGDQLLLPPKGVITGEINPTWNAGGSSVGGETSGATTTTQAEVNSSIHLT